MKYLALERATLKRFVPGLDEELASLPLLQMEHEESDVISRYKGMGGGALLIPKSYSGLGANPIEAVRMQRALGSRSPSLAIGICMHNFSVATLVEFCKESGGMEFLLLEGIAKNNLLLASGFAEGRGENGILTPVMTAQKTDKGYIVNGSKKPCSLSRSMDLLTASVVTVGPNSSGAAQETAVALIPAQKEGIEVKKFWASWILAGAESHEVSLNNVLIEDQLIFPITSAGQLEYTQLSGLIWFEILISASYLGIASALVERVILAGKGSAFDRAFLGSETEAAMAAIEATATSLNNGDLNEDVLARTLFVRYAVQQSIARVSNLSCELLGGMAFIGSSEVSYLYAAAKALSFHPPSQRGISEDLVNYLAGGSINIK